MADEHGVLLLMVDAHSQRESAACTQHSATLPTARAQGEAAALGGISWSAVEFLRTLTTQYFQKKKCW